MKQIDAYLNKVTMYQLTVNYLRVLIAVAIVLSFLKLLPYSPIDMGISTLLAVITCYVANYICAKLFNAVTNYDSVLITALILSLIIPVKFPYNATFMILASVFAMGSKYFVTISKQHIINPAAAAVAGVAMIAPNHVATWWIGTPIMMPFVVIGGILLARKLQREKLILIFLGMYLSIVGVSAYIHNGSLHAIGATWYQSTFQSALFFFTFVMFTEPATMPATEKLQIYYAALVAILYATPQIRISTLEVTPELALVIGNAFSYIISPKYHLNLPLKWKKEEGKGTYVFAFPKPKDFTYIPGQYMGWTLPHKSVDQRGIRRYFSLASSPTEKELLLAVRFYTPSSSYKKQLVSLLEEQPIIASELSGNFILPKKINTPMVFIAGGVGIAPFRSMIKYIIDKKIQTNIIVLYANRNEDEIIFQQILKQAEEYGVKTIYTLTNTQNISVDWKGEKGYITTDKIKVLIPDYKKRTFYISGPQLMVQRFQENLRDLHIASKQMKADFFPGYQEK